MCKQKKLIILGCALLLGTTFSLYHWKDRIMKPSDNHQTSLSNAHFDAQINDFTLSGGQPVWFIENKELDIVTIGLVFEYAGQFSTSADLAGISTMLASMMDEGAGQYDAQAFKRLLIEKNMHFEVSAGQDNIVVIFKTVSENIKAVCELVKIALTQPRFDDEPLTRAKQQTQTGLMQSLHSPQLIAKETLNQTIHGDKHPYVSSIKQKLAAVNTFNKENLTKYLKENVTQANVKIAVTGNIVHSELKAHLNDLMAALPAGEKKSASADSALLNAGKTLFEPMDVPQAVIMFAHPGISRADPDFYAYFLLVQALGGNSFESRLWKEIREDRGLAYSISLSPVSQKLKYALVGGTATKSASVDEVIGLIKKQWTDVANNGITSAELDLQKRFAIESYPLTFDESHDIVKAMLSYQMDNLPKTYLNEREHLLQKVTVEDVKRVAKKLLDTNKITFCIVGKKG